MLNQVIIWSLQSLLEIMLKLRDPACLDDLILLLDRRDVMQAKANRLATMAVIDLGPAARAKVAQHLLSLVQSGGALVKDQESRTYHFSGAGVYWH